jgi:hypothetical protein
VKENFSTFLKGLIVETKIVLQLVDIQEIAKNAGVEITKAQAKTLLNECFTDICSAQESILGEKAKVLFGAN